MTRLHNPLLTDEILREYLGDISVTGAALKLGIHRVTLSRLVACAAGITAGIS
jgi:antitoxin HigA-1